MQFIFFFIPILLPVGKKVAFKFKQNSGMFATLANVEQLLIVPGMKDYIIHSVINPQINCLARQHVGVN